MGYSDYIVTVRCVKRWRGKKFVYRVPIKGKVEYEAGYFYAPYIPLTTCYVASNEDGETKYTKIEDLTVET